MNESLVGIIIGRRSMDEFELFGVEHSDDIFLEVVAEAIQKLLMFPSLPFLFETLPFSIGLRSCSIRRFSWHFSRNALNELIRFLRKPIFDV